MVEEARAAEQERFQRLVEAEDKRKLEEAERLELEKREVGVLRSIHASLGVNLCS